MPVLQLQVDIDSDVHPELHDILAAVTRTASRTERLKQLAAQGLIWEQLRVQARPSAPGGTPAAADPAIERDDDVPATPTVPTRPSPAQAAPPLVAVAKRLPPSAVPVLWDAIDEPIRPPSRAAAVGAAQVPLAGTTDAPVLWPASGDALADDDGPDGVPAAPVGADPDRPHGTSAVRRPRTRTRLLRMKEMGLFRND